VRALRATADEAVPQGEAAAEAEDKGRERKTRTLIYVILCLLNGHVVMVQ
jgi:hypothetical protein